MLYEDNVLAHYGIKEQRWGVRRFQNKDGSLTEEGRKRYLSHLDDSFSSVGKKIKKNTKSSAKAIRKEPIDLEVVQERGGLSPKEAKECSLLADKIYDEARAIEPHITNDVVFAIHNSGSDTYGLEHRIKQPSSLASKIGADAKEKDISFEDASKQIKDVLRYTLISGDENFVANYEKTKKGLENKGYKEIRCRNYFDFYKQNKVKHKSVQCVYEDEDGNVFELQFHTPLSQSAKELKIPLYEKRRKKGLSKKEIVEIEKQMRDLAEYVPYPNNIFNVVSYG